MDFKSEFRCGASMAVIMCDDYHVAVHVMVVKVVIAVTTHGDEDNQGHSSGHGDHPMRWCSWGKTVV